MLHPSSLIRLAVLGGVALLVRAIVREASEARREAAMLPPPGRGKDGRAEARGRQRTRREGAASR